MNLINLIWIGLKQFRGRGVKVLFGDLGPVKGPFSPGDKGPDLA